MPAAPVWLAPHAGPRREVPQRLPQLWRERLRLRTWQHTRIQLCAETPCDVFGWHACSLAQITLIILTSAGVYLGGTGVQSLYQIIRALRLIRCARPTTPHTHAW